MPVIKALLVFSVASLYLAVVSGRAGLDVLHHDAKLLCRSLKRRQPVGLVRAQTVGKLQPVICLNTAYFDAVPAVKLNCTEEKVLG